MEAGVCADTFTARRQPKSKIAWGRIPENVFLVLILPLTYPQQEGN
jgi:hypothetical protein